MKKFVVVSVMGMFACGVLFVNAHNPGMSRSAVMNDSIATDTAKCEPAKNDTCKKELAMIISGCTLTNDAMSNDSVATDTTKTEPAKANPTTTENTLLVAMNH